MSIWGLGEAHRTVPPVTLIEPGAPLPPKLLK